MRIRQLEDAARDHGGLEDAGSLRDGREGGDKGAEEAARMLGVNGGV